MIFSNITKKIENKYNKIEDNHKLGDYLKISFLLSIFLFCADIIYAYSLKNIEIAVNSALSIIATIIPVILAAIFLKEKITKTKILALTIILFSIYLLK
jgi:drug/metabolite transporter (DMT)-like permease